jgi:hypothetical protein
MNNERNALQNFATTIGLTIYEKIPEDKRRTVKMYFAQKGAQTISPVLNYDQMNHFLLGWARCSKYKL